MEPHLELEPLSTAMAHIIATHPEDDILGNIGRVVTHTFQIARNDQRIQSLRRTVRMILYVTVQ